MIARKGKCGRLPGDPSPRAHRGSSFVPSATLSFVASLLSWLTHLVVGFVKKRLDETLTKLDETSLRLRLSGVFRQLRQGSFLTKPLSISLYIVCTYISIYSFIIKCRGYMSQWLVLRSYWGALTKPKGILTFRSSGSLFDPRLLERAP